MNNADLPKFSQQWLACYELYGKPCSDAAVALAFQVLAKFELGDVSRALTQHALDPDAGRFPPKPADLVKFITGDPDSRPLAAWTQAEGAIRAAGPYRTVVFDDPLTMRVLSDMGGWVQFCDVLDKDLPFRRNEFCTRYRGYMLNPPSEYPARLQGIFNDPNPALIGNPAKAEEILRLGKSGSVIAMKSVNDFLAGAVAQIGVDREAP